MIRLPSIERLLHALSQRDVVDELKDVERPVNVVELPQCLFRLVLANIATELADDRRLADLLLPQRRHDPLDIGPLGDDERFVDLARWLDERITVVRCRMESHQRFDPLVDVAIPRRKGVAERVQDPEIHLIGTVGIR